MRNLAAVFAVSLLALVGSPAATAEGEAKVGRWVLDFKHGPLNTVAWTDAAGTTTAYHYMTMSVTNNTAFAREWRPMVRAIVDTKPDAPYYALPLAEALDAIRRQEKNSKLVMLHETKGRLEPGETKSCVAIFGRLCPMYDRVHVQVHGLVDSVAVFKIEKYSGDRVVVVDAAYYDRNKKVLDALRQEAKESGSERLPSPEVEVHEMLERRYWDMEYTRRGDEFQAEDSVIRFEREGWKLDGDPKTLRIISKQS